MCRLFCPFLALLVSLLLWSGCSDPESGESRLVVAVRADAELIPQIAFLDLYTDMGYRTIDVGTQHPLPLSFEVSGAADESRLVTIRARAGDGNTLAERSAVVPVVGGRRLAWLVNLSARCGATCGAGLCGNCGTCVKSVVTPEELVALDDDDDGLSLAGAPLLCDELGQGDGDVDDDVDAGDGGDGDGDADAATAPDAGDGDGDVVDPISDASVDALTVVTAGAVAAAKNVAVTTQVAVRMPADTQFPLPLQVSASAGALFAADCSSPVPAEMGEREITLCLHHMRPTAVRNLPITIDATVGDHSASGVVELRMPAIAMAGGQSFMCASLEDGSLQCWGNAADARIPNPDLPSFNNQVEPFHVAAAPAFKQLRLGGAFGCGMTAEGSVRCWGSHQLGQLGRSAVIGGAFTDFASIANPSTGGGVQLSSGVDDFSACYEFACALKDGRVYCWGNSLGGLMGPGVTGLVGAPRHVAMPGEPTSYTLSMSVGGRHACAVVGENASATKGKVYCWGDHTQGRLGDDDWVEGMTPTPVQAKVIPHDAENVELLVSRVRAWGDQTCAEADGKLFCWGENGGGQTGTGLEISVLAPSQVPLKGKLIDWALGGPGGCAIVEETVNSQPTRLLYCWGSSSDGEFADPSSSSSPTPTLIEAAPKNADSVSLGWSTVCVIKAGLPYCWGSNYSGELGTQPSLASNHRPLLASRLNPLSGLEEIALPREMWGTACGRSDTAAWCWGLGNDKSLGYPDAVARTVPVEVQGLREAGQTVQVTQVVSEGRYGCAIVDEEMYCWGLSPWADFGSRAVKVARPDAAKAPRQLVVDSRGKACGLFGTAPNAAVYCWEQQLSSAIPFASGNIKAISLGEWFMCAIVDDRVQCAGWNGYLQLGSSEVAKDADSGPVFVDLDLAVGEKVVAVAAREKRSCAVTSAGDVWCWGDNIVPSLVSVHTGSDKAVDVRGGNNNLCVLRAIDGVASQIWCEGTNSQHLLSGEKVSSELAFWRVPDLVPPIKAFDTGGQYNMGTMCAQDAEGFKCSGNNQNRQAGRGPDFYETTPLPVMGWMN